MIPKVLEVRTFNEKKEVIDALCCTPAAAQDLNSILTLAPIGSTVEVSIKSIDNDFTVAPVGSNAETFLKTKDDVNSNMPQS